MTGYVRQDTSNNIADGNVINAADLDSEFDGLQAAFNASTGHVHDGTTGNGAPILVVGPTQDVVVSATAVTPKTTNTVDIGSSSLKFKDIFITGTATLPTVSATTGNITTVNATTVDTTNLEVTTLKAKDGTAAGSIADSTGVVTLASAILTTADINGGTLDNVVIGGTTAAAASVTTLTTSSTVTLNGGTANGVAYLNGSKVLTTGSALTFDGTNVVVGNATVANGRVRYQNATNDAYGEISTVGGADFRIESTYGSAAGYKPMTFYTNGSEQMRLTSTGLGIGTSSPTNPLTVGGTTRGTVMVKGTNGASPYIALDHTATTNGRQYNIYSGGINAGDFNIYDVTASANRLTIDSSGNLGLGVTPSAWSGVKAFQVQNAALWCYANNAYLSANTYSDAVGPKYISTGYATQLTQANGQFQFLTAPSGTAGNAISFTQAMTLDASGNLGVGTTSPAYKLHAAEESSGGARLRLENLRTATFDGDFFGQIQFFGNDPNGSGIRAAMTALCRNVSGATDLTFATAPSGGSYTERARIDSSGNLLINGTSNPNSAKVFVIPTSSGPAFGSQGYSGDTANPAAIFGKYDNDTTTAQVFVRFIVNNNGGGSGQITANGANNAAFGSYSDERLKTNIVDLPSQLANIMALRPVEFDYIESEGGGHQIGFIAQNMESVYPDVVGEREDGMKMIAGWSKTESRLVKAIQEQQAIINAQQAALTALTARVAALEAA